MYAVIDVGSNSVRLMYSNGQKTIKKWVEITRLSQGLSSAQIISLTALERTANAVSFFVKKAKQDGANKVYVFATAGVRQARNALEFTNKVFKLTGINVDVISGEKEAVIGALGAIGDKDGAIIDLGGASTEISVMQNRQIIYNKSLDFGAVKLTETFGQDRQKVSNYVKDRLIEFGEVPSINFYGIGGTATTISSVLKGLSVYDPQIIHGSRINLVDLDNKINELYSLSTEERKKVKGLQPERAEIITAGATALFEIMKYLNVDYITVSEMDNLEGYLKLQLEKL